MFTTLKTLGVATALLVAGLAGATSAQAAGPGAAAKGADMRVRPLTETVAVGTQGIRSMLQRRGYHSIVFTDRSLPVYRVTACKGGDRFSLRINRFGEIRDRDRIGRCGPIRVQPRIIIDLTPGHHRGHGHGR